MSSSHTDQEKKLINIVLNNPNIKEILHASPFPNGESWYLAAGAITQTVWNTLSDMEITDGINDYDLIYFDNDTDPQKEKAHQERISQLFQHLNVDVEVVNEARVHEWFHEYFGQHIQPYTSCEDAISSWSPCSAVGISRINDECIICAPFGLDDLFNMVQRPNMDHQAHFSPDAYRKKSKRWAERWPNLTVIPWEEE